MRGVKVTEEKAGVSKPRVAGRWRGGSEDGDAVGPDDRVHVQGGGAEMNAENLRGCGDGTAASSRRVESVTGGQKRDRGG